MSYIHLREDGPLEPQPTRDFSPGERIACRQTALAIAARLPTDPACAMQVLAYVQAIYSEFVHCPTGEAAQ